MSTMTPVFECKECHSRNVLWHIHSENYEIICRKCEHRGSLKVTEVDTRIFIQRYLVDKNFSPILEAQWDIFKKFLANAVS